MVRLAAPILGLALAVSACSGSDSPSSTTQATANPITDGTLDPSDPLAYATFELPATPQCVALGRRFAVELDAKPSEGLQWKVVAPAVGPGSASIIVLGGTEFVTVAGEEATGTERQRVTFAASALGETDVTVRYVDATGAPVSDVAEETWTITVTPDGTCPAPPVTDTTIAFED